MLLNLFSVYATQETKVKVGFTSCLNIWVMYILMHFYFGARVQKITVSEYTAQRAIIKWNLIS